MRKVRTKMKQCLCLMLAAAMLVTVIPQNAMIAYAQEDDIVEAADDRISDGMVFDGSEYEQANSISGNEIAEESEAETSTPENKTEDASEEENGTTENEAESNLEDVGSISENELEEIGSLSGNDAEETESVSGNDTEEIESVSGNDLEEKKNESENDMEETESVSGNDVEEAGSVSGNDVEDNGSVSENDAEVTESVSGNDLEEITVSDNQLNKDEYSVSENQIKVSATKEGTEENKKIQIVVDDEMAEISARIGAQAVKYEETEQGFVYTVDTDDTLTVTVTAKDNYKIVSAVTKTEGVKDKNEKVKAAGFTFSVKATANATTTVVTEALYKGILKQNENEIGITGKAYLLDAGLSYDVIVLHGNQLAELKSVAVEKNKSKDTKAEIGEDTKSAKFSVAYEEAENTKLKLKVTTAENKIITYAVNVRPEIQSVTVKGVSKGVLKQTIDTTKEYKVTFKPASIDTERIYIDTEEGVKAVLENGILKVTTKSEVKNAAGKIYFYKKGLGNAEDTKIESATVTVNTTAPNALAKAKPTAKVVETTDTSIVLNLGTPKNVETPIQGAQYYEITVIPNGTDVPDSITDAVKDPFYIERTGLSQVETIVVNNAGMGNGQTWKYSLEIRLVQLNEKKAANEITEEDVLSAFASKLIKVSASTQKPAYETKLSIKKGTTTVYTGQSNIVIGTPNYSKTTTYRELDRVEDITENLAEEQKLQVEYQDGKLVTSITKGSQTAIGKHTIIAYAKAPEGSKAATATITVTVVRGIEDLMAVAEGGFIFKQYNKEASLTVKPVYNTLVTSELPEPKTKKVTYEAVDKDRNEIGENSPLYKMVKVKNGKITIDKKYVVTSVADENKFCIKITAADYKGNTVCAYSDTIQIKSTTPDLGEAVLVTAQPNEQDEYTVISRGNQTLKVEEFNAGRLVAVKKGKENKAVYTSEEFVECAELSFASNNKAVKIAEDGSVFTEQIAKNITLTASTKDGSKKKVSLAKLTLEYTEPIALGVNISRGTYDYMGENPVFYTIGSPDSRQVSYKASNNEIFKLEVMKQDENDNWCTISEEECMNYTLSLKGATQLSKDKNTYLITATAAETTITLTDKANSNAKTVYVLKNEAGSSKELTSLKAATKDTLIGGKYSAAQTVTFEVTAGGDYAYTDKYAEIRVDAASAQKSKSAYESLLNATKDIDGYHLLNEETIEEYDENGELIDTQTTVTFSVSFNDKIDLGSYRLNITLGEIVNGDFIADTKTTSVTLKTIEQKKQNLTFTPNSSYSISPADNTPIVLSGNLNDENAFYRFTGVHNVISGGEVNRFKDYFEFVPRQEKKAASIRLKSGISAADLLNTEGKAHCSAFVDYEVYDKNGVLYKEDTVKITIEVKRTPTKTMSPKVLPVIVSEQGEMFTTFMVTSGSNNVNIPYAFVETGSFGWEPYGTSGIKLVTDSKPADLREGERTTIYWLPDSSCFADELNSYDEDGNITAYNKLLQEYGIKWNGTIKFKNIEEFENNDSGNNKIISISTISVNKKHFIRETEEAAGYYRIPLKYTKKAAIDIKSVEVLDCYSRTEGDLGEDFSFITVQVEDDDTMYMEVQKAPMAQILDENTSLRPSNIKLRICYKGEKEPDEIKVGFRISRSMTFKKAVDEMERKKLSFMRIGWSQDKEKTLEALEKNLSKRFQILTRDDSDAFIKYVIALESVVEPTRLADGGVEVMVELINTLTGESLEYPVTVTISKLGAWPEDIIDDLNRYLENYQTEEEPKIFNHTIAEDIANDIREQEFITKHTQFRVDVANLTKKRATELENGTCSVKVRILDTTGKGAACENTYSWPIYQLDTLEQVKTTIMESLASKEADNRTDQEMVESWIDSVIRNRDISWAWKEEYHKELATHEKEGSITGSIELQNPKSVMEVKKVEVPVQISLKTMTDPESIYQMVEPAVGQYAVEASWFYEEIWDEESGIAEYKWLTDDEMADLILEKANTVLKEAGEMYYVEYALDEAGKDMFEHCPPTYKTARTISYTLNIKNEFTDEVAGIPVVVENFVLEEANGEWQTLIEWEADILALVEEGNKSGRFTNETSVWDIDMLLSEACTNSYYSHYVNQKETEDGTEDDFVLQEATFDADGSIKVSVTLTDGAMENPKKRVLKLTLIIPALSQSMDEAYQAAIETIQALREENMISNDTTADDILDTVIAVLKKSKYEVSWAEDAPCNIIPATEERAGSITGELLIRNLHPEEGEAETAVVSIEYEIAKLKTKDEAETAVREAVTGEAVLELASRGESAVVKQRILDTANEVIKYDGFEVCYKKSASEDVFNYTPSSYKEAGTVSYTLLLISKNDNAAEPVEIIVEETMLPVDVTKQNLSNLKADIKNILLDMVDNEEVSNETSAEELLQAARSVTVNPNLEVAVWNEEEYGKDGSLHYIVGGREMSKVEASETRTGYITIYFVITDTSMEKPRYNLYTQKLIIPKVR